MVVIGMDINMAFIESVTDMYMSLKNIRDFSQATVSIFLKYLKCAVFI